MTALEDLRSPYGDAHLIKRMGSRWVTQRRDSHATISAEGPGQLLGLTRLDYAGFRHKISFYHNDLVVQASRPATRSSCAISKRSLS